MLVCNGKCNEISCCFKTVGKNSEVCLFSGFQLVQCHSVKIWDYVCLTENIRVSWKNESFLQRTKITEDNFQLTAELEIPGLGWMMAHYLKSVFHTLEIMAITWKTSVRPPATRIKLWIICTWRYRARESGIFRIT